MRRKRPTVAEQIRLGAYFFTTGALDLAIAQFTEATKRAPHSATAWMNLGAAYLEKKEPHTDLGRHALELATGWRPHIYVAGEDKRNRVD